MCRCPLLVFLSALALSWAAAQPVEVDKTPFHPASLILSVAAPAGRHDTSDGTTDPLPKCPTDKIAVSDGRGGFICKDKKHTTSDTPELNNVHYIERREIVFPPLYKCPSDKIPVRLPDGTFICKDRHQKAIASDNVDKCPPGKILVPLPNGRFLCENDNKKGIGNYSGEINNVRIRQRHSIGRLCPSCSLAKCPSDKIMKRFPHGGFICLDKRHKRGARFYSPDLAPKCPSDMAILEPIRNGRFICKNKTQKEIHSLPQNDIFGPLHKCPSDKEPVYLGNGVWTCKDKKHEMPRISQEKKVNN
ncbi:uncharacterized protein LOC133522243 [Cydia pomonella]|uniref:uncharacterized protein LOC133522243 n=1 Tax=Cydia pomonella TaxID=82600 RepID=UPI002ADDF3FB|nr:uncharacterized protein LOC133522243 [Cydia pomonella]XP_061713496.1 uncharacterized protein LOC133522243 [Cydia pomonella]XP_061713497.1 uncharacterized protein LOC133522243 [Cydia pomonella]